MMRKTVVWLLMAVLGASGMCVAAVAHGGGRVLLPVQVDGKWGYIDTAGKMVIPPVSLGAEQAYRFSEGLGAVKVDGAWGYIDETGGFVIAPKYEQVHSFQEGMAAVCDATSHLWGFVDRSGRLIVPCRYLRVGGFSDGLALVQRNSDDLFGFIDRTGREVIKPRFSSAGNFGDGLAPVSIGEGKAGYIDKRGKVVIPFRYVLALEFCDGRAVVQVGNLSTGKWGFIDKTGRMAIPAKYDYADSFTEGLAPVVCRDGTIALIDINGKRVVNLDAIGVIDPGVFSEGLAAVVTKKGSGYIDRRGKFVIPPHDWQSAGSFHGGIAGIDVDYELSGYIDRTGKWIWKPTK